MADELPLKIVNRDGRHGYDRATRVRVQRELELLRQLSSPHTVRVFDGGTSRDGWLFVVFEMVPGRDLSDVRDELGTVPPDIVIHIARQILEALGEAHAKGLLHRDIKPENIRIFTVDADAHFAKLLDFGLARATDTGGPSITETGEVIGTPRYMSPEQLTERPLTPSSDIYALGVVMLELLVGSDAMHGTSWMDQLDRLRTGHVLSVPEQERIGPALLRVINRMTARDPGDRFPSAQSVLAALQPAPRSAPVSSADEPRYSARVVGAATTMLVLVVIALGWGISRKTEHRPPPRAVTPNTVVKHPQSAQATPTHPKDAGVVIDRDMADSDVLPFRVDASFEALSLPSGCGKPPPFRGRGWIDHLHTRSGRSSVAYIPKTYDSAQTYPLILLLHPGGRQAPDFLTITNLESLAEREKFVVLAPVDELIQPWIEALDLKRAKRAIWTAHETLCIDREQTFVIGHAAGGRIAEWLSCSDFVAAGVATSFREYADETLCESAPSKPFMTLSPTASKHIPVPGGTGCAGDREKVSLAAMEARWVERNDCRGPRRSVYRHGKSQCFARRCETPYISCVLDGGHPWPGAPQRLQDLLNHCDGEPPDFPHSEYIWQFFQSVAASSKK